MAASGTSATGHTVNGDAAVQPNYVHYDGGDPAFVDSLGLPIHAFTFTGWV